MMRRIGIRNAIIGSLNAVGIGILLFALLIEVRPSVSVSSPKEHVDPATLASLSPAAGRRRIDLRAALAAPVFHVDRNPYQPPVVAAAAPQIETLRLELAGITGGQGGRWAYLKDLEKNETLRVGAGDTIRGWTVSTIEDDLVRLERGSDVMTLGTGEIDQASSAPDPRARRTNKQRTRTGN